MQYNYVHKESPVVHSMAQCRIFAQIHMSAGLFKEILYIRGNQ